ncbi:MAG: hypothetical protein GYB66_12505 [Chloroflexi bacterium]|nr:hypothetical protein [Chloroflexota bacterium]
MQRWIWVVGFAALVIVGSGLVWSALQSPAAQTYEASLVNSIDFELPEIGFSRVDGRRQWSFPQDYGPHADYQREQWQLTLQSDCPVRLDIIFDRITVIPEELAPQRPSEWALQRVITADLRLEDQEGDVVADTSLASRAAIGLAGADETHVWVENWSFDWEAGTLSVATNDITLALTLELEEPDGAGIEGGWYQYARQGTADGTLQNRTRDSIDCRVTLRHRFGTFERLQVTEQ